MKTLYEAGNAIEAHMLVDLLRQEGVTAHVLGAHLQGAIGELPAAGLVRVVIEDEADFDKGRDLIRRWEASMPADEPVLRHAPARGASRGWLKFALGLVTGVLATMALYRTPVSDGGVDRLIQACKLR